MRKKTYEEDSKERWSEDSAGLYKRHHMQSTPVLSPQPRVARALRWSQPRVPNSVCLMPRQHNAAANTTAAGSHTGVHKVWPEYSPRGPPERSLDIPSDPGQQPPHAQQARWAGGSLVERRISNIEHRRTEEVQTEGSLALILTRLEELPGASSAGWVQVRAPSVSAPLVQ